MPSIFYGWMDVARAQVAHLQRYVEIALSQEDKT